MTAMFILIAALGCDYGFAPFFILPPPAKTNGVTDPRCIPGSVDFTNAVKRLNGDTMVAVYGTTEAFLERRIFPVLSNYGGGRGKHLKDLATSDFGNGQYQELFGNTWVGTIESFPHALKPAAHRDFSKTNGLVDIAETYDDRGNSRQETNIVNLTACGRRLNLANDLFNQVVVKGFGDFYGLDPSGTEDRGLFTWLDPRFDPTHQINEQWHEDDQLATANWRNNYLLAIGELDHGGIFNETNTPFINKLKHIKWITSNDGREYDVNQYMLRGDFPRVSSFNTDILSGDRDEKPRTRNLSVEGYHITNVFCYSTEVADYKEWNTNVDTRILWDKYAVANAAISSCNVLYDPMIPNNTFFWESTNYYGVGQDRHHARLRTKEMLYDIGTLSLTKRYVKSENSSAYYAADPENRQTCLYVPFEFWELRNLENSCEDFTCTTNTASDEIQQAWNDYDARASYAIKLTNCVTIADLNMTDGKWWWVTNSLEPGIYPVKSNITPSPPDYEMYHEIFFFQEDRFGESVATGRVTLTVFQGNDEHDARWDGWMIFKYVGKCRGREYLKTIEPALGPTVVDYHGLFGKDYALDHSIAPFGFADMLSEGSSSNRIWRCSDMFDHVTIGVTTNHGVIRSVSQGDNFVWGHPKTGFDTFTNEDVTRDTWASFKIRNLCHQNEKIMSYSDQYAKCVNILETKEEEMERATAIIPSYEFYKPHSGVARNIQNYSEDKIKGLYEQINFGIGYGLSYGDPDAYPSQYPTNDVVFVYDPTDERIGPVWFAPANNPKSKLPDNYPVVPLEFNRIYDATNNCERMSYALDIIHSPIMIHYFNFPMMQGKTIFNSGK